MTIQEFIGVSQSRSYEDALTDALFQVEQFHKNLPGADRLVAAETLNVIFGIGGFAGEDILEVKVSVTVT